MSLDVKLTDYLKNSIELKKDSFKPSDKLLSERKLCEMFNCSRTVVRKSLKTLEFEGWINKDNEGNYVVAKQRFRIELNSFRSYSDFFKEKKVQNQKKIVSFSKVLANRFVSKKLNVPIGTECFCLRLVREIEEEPLIIETVYILESLCPSLIEQDIVDKSLYSIFKEKYELYVDRAVQEINIKLADNVEAALLKIEENTPVIKSCQVVYSTTNNIIEYRENVMLMERFEFVK